MKKNIIIVIMLIGVLITGCSKATQEQYQSQIENKPLYSIAQIQEELTKEEFLNAIETNFKKYEKESHEDLFMYFVNEDNFDFYKLTDTQRSNIVLDYFGLLIRQKSILDRLIYDSPQFIREATERNAVRYLMNYHDNNYVTINTEDFIKFYPKSLEVDNKKEIITLYNSMQNHEQLSLEKHYRSLVSFYNFYNINNDVTILSTDMLDAFHTSLTSFSWKILALKNENPEKIKSLEFKETFLIDFINLLKYEDLTSVELQDQINNIKIYMQRVIHN